MTQLTRRRLLLRSGAGLMGLSSALQTLQALAETPPVAVPGLSTTSLSADEVRATMAALADTIVPGPAGGADPEPGAVEAGVVDELYDPFYGVADAFPAVAADLQLATARVLGRPAAFALALPYPDRERVLRDRITEAPAGGQDPLATAYQAVGVLVYLAYYGTARSDLGLQVIGLPPHSDGYWPDHSYRVRFKTMTRDGNPR